MNIVILGANGMLGYTLTQYIKNIADVTPITSKQFNVLHNNINDLSQYIKNSTVLVVNSIGVIKPRIKNYTTEEIFKINSWFPIQLGNYLNKYFPYIKMIHVSTDCVFTGNKGNYKIDDLPDADDIYGLSKAIGEACLNNAMVIRTSIIGEELNNKYSLLEWAKAQKGLTVNGWENHIWSGVTTLELANYIRFLLTNNLINNGLTQLASLPINKYDLLKLIDEVYNLNLVINKTESTEKCDRSLICTEQKFMVPSLKIQLIRLKSFFENDTK